MFLIFWSFILLVVIEKKGFKVYMNIGSVNIKTPIALGPMAGVTDLPFRLLCKEQGCGLLYTEMVSAKAVLYNNKNTKDYDISKT